MTTTITHRAGIITPTAVRRFKAGATVQNVEHEILSRAESDYTLRPVSLLDGTFTLVFDTEAAARAAHAALGRAETFTIANPDVAAVNMAFVLAEGGRLGIEQDDDVDVWTVDVPFQEVTA